MFNKTAKQKGFMASPFGKAMVKKSADTMGRAMTKTKATDGVAKKGKTKGKKVAMAKGGKMSGC